MNPELVSDTEDIKPKFKSALAQFLASTAIGLVMFDMGLVLAYPTIALKYLYDDAENRSFTLTTDQASWFASICLIFEPIGCLFTGLILKKIGRKCILLLSNIPYIITWLLFYFGNSVAILYIAQIVAGFAVGSSGVLISVQIGEFTEPRCRGVLMAFVQQMFFFARLVMFGLGALLTWRNTAIACTIIPIISAIALYLTPESPLWLISKGRLLEAEKALCWLRGWKKPEDVKEEFNLLIEYNENVENDKKKVKNTFASPNPTGNSQEMLTATQTTLKQKIIYFFRPELRRPLILMIIFLILIFTSGITTMIPYYIYIFGELNITFDHGSLTILMGVADFIGTTLCTALVKYTGKKSLSLASFAGCAICSFGLSLVAYLILTPTWAIPFLILFTFFTHIGVGIIPWMLQGEIYPLEGKSMAVIITTTFFSITGFIAIKIFFVFENLLKLSGLFVFFTFFNVFGIIYLAIRMPETEGKTFEEIKLYFLK